MRLEQRDHFEKENCLKDLTSYSDFVRSVLTGQEILLDLGTGAGYGVLAVADQVVKVIATDIETDMLDAARTTCQQLNVLNIEYRQMAAECIALPDASLDVVQIRFSLHHFDNAAKALSETARVLKSGGLLLLADAFFPPEIVQVWTITSLLRHGKWTPYFTYRQHMDMLSEAGFEIQKIKPMMLDQTFDDFYSSAPITQQESLRAIVSHLTEEQQKLMHFRDVDGQAKYSYDGFELIARKKSN